MTTVTTTGGSVLGPAPPRRDIPLSPIVPVSRNGCFEFDRVLKSGTVQKRAQKTRAWKPAYLVLRPNTLYVYKNANEEKLRHKIHLVDLTAVAPLRDPRNKRDHVFGLFLSSRNYHFQAATAKEAEAWLDILRREARIDEEDEELFLASPLASRQSSSGAAPHPQTGEWLLSSSPEGPGGLGSLAVPTDARHLSHMLDSSGMSGNELVSHSDFSDGETRRPRGASMGALAAYSPPSREGAPATRPPPEQELDRVIWQGRLHLLRSKGGVRQWKKTWAVLRPRNLILYRDESEYAARLVIPMPSVVNAVDLDPLSRGRAHCLQVITDERSYRFCAADEEELVQCLGAFKSLLTKRKELESRVAAAAAAAGAGASLSVSAPASTGPMLNMSTSPPPPTGAQMVLPIR